MPPRATLEPDDIVTPTEAARILGVPVSTVRVWIHRYKIRPLGKKGRWNAYDFNAVAAIEAARHRAGSAAQRAA